MPDYKIPKSIEIKFDYKKEIPELSNRVYRIIWVSISIGHIRDQYFMGRVSAAVRAIKRERPFEFDHFMAIVRKCGLNIYGTKPDREKHRFCAWPIPDNKWWRQVWRLIYYNGDIELRSNHA